MARRVACLLLLLLALAGLAGPVQAQEPIVIASERLDNQFPEALTFHIGVKGRVRIVKVTLYYDLRGGDSPTVVPLEFEPATRVQASHRWRTRGSTIPPGVPVLYHWEVEDEAGNRLVSEEKTFYYNDIRFSWKTLEDEEVSVLWYDGGDDWGQEVYEAASLSLRGLEEKLAAHVEFPIRVVVYSSEEDFRSAFPPIGENIGGMAFPESGMTVQILSVGDPYLGGVIPHEISHLLFFQLTDNPLSTPPAWLNEGLAVYNEWFGQSYYDAIVARAAERGELLQLDFIVGNFPRDDERVYLAYGQSYCLVKRLIDEYGGEKLGQYLRAFKDAKTGFDDEAAFEEVYGLPLMDFVNAWRASLGAGPELVPTPFPTMVPMPTPPPLGWKPTKTPTPPAPPAPTAAPTPQPAATLATLPTAAPTPAPAVYPPAGGGLPAWPYLLGGSILALVLFVVVLLVVLRKR
jgi:hypothetical protein